MPFHNKADLFIFTKKTTMTRNPFLIFLIVVISSCQSVKIKNSPYKISDTNVEFGCIGQEKNSFTNKNHFDYKGLAKLENQIRLSVEFIPFDNKTYQAYQQQKKYNQNLAPIAFNDTLAKKPELTTIRLMDVSGYLNQLNAGDNRDIFSLVQQTKKNKVVTSIAAVFNNEDIIKLKQADTYYLINNQEKKYNLLLLKQGKKIDVIDMNKATVVCYQSSSFCWATNSKKKWYIADLVEGSCQCKGNTTKNYKEKEIKNLYKM